MILWRRQVPWFFVFLEVLCHFLQSCFFFFFRIFIYLAALGLSCRPQDLPSSLEHAGSLAPDQGLYIRPLYYECGVLATGPPEKSHFLWLWRLSGRKWVISGEKYFSVGTARDFDAVSEFLNICLLHALSSLLWQNPSTCLPPLKHATHQARCWQPGLLSQGQN